MHKSLKQLKLTFTFLSLIILLIVSLVLFLAQIALAQVTTERLPVGTTSVETRPALPLMRQAATGTVAATTSPVFGGTREDRAAQLEQRRALIASRKAEHRAVLAETIQARITTVAENATKRLTAAIDTLSAITERVRGYAETHAANGIDVSGELATLERVDTLLTDAATAIAGSEVDIEYVVTSDTPRVDWSSVRARFTSVRDILKEARELLRKTVTSLKDASAQTTSPVTNL